MENHHFSWVNQLSMAIFNSKLFVYQRVTFPGTVSLSWSMSRPRCAEASEVSPRSPFKLSVGSSISKGISTVNHPAIGYHHLSAWWCHNHLEKWWSSSMGRMTSHIYIYIYEMENRFHVPNHQPVMETTHFSLWKKVCDPPWSWWRRVNPQLFLVDIPMMFPFYVSMIPHEIPSIIFAGHIGRSLAFCPITNQYTYFPIQLSLFFTPKTREPQTSPGSELLHLTQLLASHVRLGRWCFHQLGKWLTGNIWKPPRKVRKVPWLKHRESAWQLEQPSAENSKLQWIDLKNGTFPGNLRNHQIHVPGFPFNVSLGSRSVESQFTGQFRLALSHTIPTANTIQSDWWLGDWSQNGLFSHQMHTFGSILSGLLSEICRYTTTLLAKYVDCICPLVN